jgi:hypothetical protein
MTKDHFYICKLSEVLMSKSYIILQWEYLDPRGRLWREAGKDYLLRGFINCKLSLCLTKHHAMKTYWRNGGLAPRILDLGTRRRWVVTFTPRQHYPREADPGTNCIEGWVDNRAVLDTAGKTKIPSPHRESNTRTPIVQHLAQPYTDWAIIALLN